LEEEIAIFLVCIEAIAGEGATRGAVLGEFYCLDAQTIVRKG